jgi:electron transport complex protein RnfD
LNSARQAQAGFNPSVRNVPRIMGLVLLALLPGALARIAFLGADVAWLLLLAVPVALGLEAMMLKLHGRPLRPFLGDLSAPLSAVLLTLLLPPLTPWWMLVLGLFVAIVLAKQAFGGLGENPFNPAMAGYAVLLLCFPSNFNSLLGNGTWVAGMYALGGLFLIGKKIIAWQTPLAMLAGAFLATGFELHGWSIATLMLAAFFIVTDPVTGCMSPRGRVLFGAGAGLLTVLLTRFGATADGLPFAILTMNLAAPWIDRHTRPMRAPKGPQP